MSDPPAGRAIGSAWRYGLLAITMAVLLIPRSVTWAITAMILVVPVTVTGVRGRDRAFFFWAAYVVSFVVFVYVRDVADAIGPGPFITYPIEADRILGLGHVPTVAMQTWYRPQHPGWWDFLGLGVYLSYFLSIPVVGVVIWRRLPAMLGPYLLGMAAVCLVSAVVHVLLPTAPPWVAGQLGRLPTVYRPVVDLLNGFVPGVYQYGLSVAGGNDVAAMPSVHSAAAAIIARATWGTKASWLGIGYAVLMGLTLIYFGEHYLIDVLAGGALALICWHGVGRFSRAIPGGGARITPLAG